LPIEWAIGSAEAATAIPLRRKFLLFILGYLWCLDL